MQDSFAIFFYLKEPNTVFGYMVTWTAKMMWNGWSKHGGQHQHGNMDSKLPHNRPSHPYLRHQCHRITICSTITNLNLAKDKTLPVCFCKPHAYSAIDFTMWSGDLARCTQMKVWQDGMWKVTSVISFLLKDLTRSTPS